MNARDTHLGTMVVQPVPDTVHFALQATCTHSGGGDPARYASPKRVRSSALSVVHTTSHTLRTGFTIHSLATQSAV
jgi:hypothetical protein